MEHTLNMSGALGLAVKLFRGVKRWTQSDLANATSGSVTQAHISKIENGETSPSNNVLSKIVSALGVSHKQLWETAEHILSSHTLPSSSDDYMACLVETGVPKDEVAELVAQVDVQTLVRYERLRLRVSTGAFTKQDFEEFVSLVDGSTADHGPVVRIIGDLSKRIGSLCQSLAESGGHVR